MKKTFLTLSIAAAVSTGIAPLTAHAMDSSAAYACYDSSLAQIASSGQWVILDDLDQSTELTEHLQNLLGDCEVHVGALIQNGCTNDSIGDIVIPEPSTPEAPEPTPPASGDTLPDDTLPGTGDTGSSTPEEQPPVTSPDDDTEVSEGEVHPYVLRIVELVNEERAKAGLNPVTLDMAAATAAQVRAQEIVSSFSHTRPNGSSFATALKEQGVSYRTAGENIAWGQRSPEAVMEGWMNSSGHRANILKESFTHIGVGYYQENGVNYWTQLFWG